MRKLQLWLLSFILVFAFVMTGCEKTGDPTKSNAAPDTRILSYSISSAAELDTSGNPTTEYLTTIYISGSDIDGAIKNYEYSLDASFPEASTEITTRQTVEVKLDFAEASTVYKAYIRAVDNLDAVDPTPASVTIQRNAGGVETEITDGPPNGANVSAAVEYDVKATSVNGSIASMEYRVNDGDWVTTTVDSTGATTIMVKDLPSGSNVLSFAGVRDDDVKDASPATVSLLVREGYAPTVLNTSTVQDGGGWFSGVPIDFTWDVDMSYYYGTLPDGAYSYAWDDDTNFDESENAMSSGWQDNNFWTASADTATAGSHTMYVKCRDAAGGIGLLSITVNVAAFNPVDGLFVRDDFSWAGGYDEPIKDVVDRGFFNGWTYTESVDTDPPLTADQIGTFSSVVLYGDGGYANQDNGELLAAYATAGGNVLITGYELRDMDHTFPTYGIYGAVFGFGAGNYGGMDGQAGTAYEGMAINLPSHLNERIYQRVYDDQPNTSSIFAVRGLDGDSRSCGVRADMPNGNVVIVLGQSIPFFNPDDQSTKDLGDMILGTEFGETK
jgi:hypothetical protein